MLVGLKNKVRQLPTWGGIILAILLGIIFGLSASDYVQYLKPVGGVFLNSLMMFVPIIVFVSIVSGIISISDPMKMGRIASKSLSLYVLTTVCGSLLSLCISQLIYSFGISAKFKNLKLIDTGLEKIHVVGSTKLSNFFVDLFPANVLTSFLEGNLIQIIIVAVITGLAINKAGNKAVIISEFFTSLSEVLANVLCIVLKFAPIGVFALVAVVAGTHGGDLLLSLAGLVAVVYLCFFSVLFVYFLFLLFVVKVNPFVFFKKMFEVQLIAFSTTSSMATLSKNIEVTCDGLGVSRSIAKFVLPLGSTVNMNGLASYLTVMAVFSAKLYGIPLSFVDMGLIILTSTLAAVGCAGVPSAGIIVLPIVLGAIGVPLEAVGLLVAINRIIDMFSTVVNVTGDTFTAVVIAKSEKELDLVVYDSMLGDDLNELATAATQS
jgi:Na+/H+-dicarboxylate symporter